MVRIYHMTGNRPLQTLIWIMTLNRRNLILTGMAAALIPASAVKASGPLNVVATTGMIADAAQFILGDVGQVTALMGAGIDPHSFRQTRSDIVAMTRADQILWHGLYLEAQMEEFLNNLARSRDVVAVAESLPKDQLLSHPDYAGRYDPHLWMAPQLWSEVVTAIADALQTARPDLAPTLEARMQEYRATLDRLHGYAQEVLGTVPENARVLVTAHDAFS